MSCSNLRQQPWLKSALYLHNIDGMVDRTAFLTLAQSIVETSFPTERDLFPIEVPTLIEKLEKHASIEDRGTARLEDQEFGLGDFYEAVKFLAVLVAAYKTVLDIHDRRKKQPEQRPSDAEIRAILRKHLAEERVEPATAARVEQVHSAEISRVANE